MSRARSCTTLASLAVFASFAELGAIAALTAASACATSEAPLPPTDPAAPQLATRRGRWLVSFTAQPTPIPVRTPFELTVVVRRSAAGPPAEVELAVDATMPEHGHGMNVVPILERLAPGTYVVHGLRFHMAGRWELTFDVTEAGVTERAAVDVVVQ